MADKFREMQEERRSLSKRKTNVLGSFVRAYPKSENIF